MELPVRLPEGRHLRWALPHAGLHGGNVGGAPHGGGLHTRSPPCFRGKLLRGPGHHQRCRCAGDPQGIQVLGTELAPGQEPQLRGLPRALRQDLGGVRDLEQPREQEGLRPAQGAEGRPAVHGLGGAHRRGLRGPGPEVQRGLDGAGLRPERRRQPGLPPRVGGRGPLAPARRQVWPPRRRQEQEGPGAPPAARRPHAPRLPLCPRRRPRVDPLHRPRGAGRRDLLALHHGRLPGGAAPRERRGAEGLVGRQGTPHPHGRARPGAPPRLEGPGAPAGPPGGAHVGRVCGVCLHRPHDGQVGPGPGAQQPGRCHLVLHQPRGGRQRRCGDGLRQ
mmetsp:Transcript_65064/g.173457  ORF Transcript_65064/g.173457 Transcript_65064/m.173457 type:complete len:333 (+) Transcript_65064:573-1571(+)